MISIVMRRISALLFVAVVTTLSFADDLGAVAHQLDSAYKRQIVAFRTPYEARDLRFDNTGRPRGSAVVGNPLSSSIARILGVSAHKRDVNVEIQRAVLVYDDKEQHLTPMYGDDLNLVSIDCKAGCTFDSLQQVLTGIFDFSSKVPDVSWTILIPESSWESLPAGEIKPVALWNLHEVYKPQKGGVETPKIVSAPDPEYPPDVAFNNLPGTVKLLTVVDERGTPVMIEIKYPLVRPLTLSAVQAVCKWRFQPAMKEGKAVAAVLKVEVNFKRDFDAR